MRGIGRLENGECREKQLGNQENQFGGLSSYPWAIVFAAICIEERCFGLVNIETLKNERYRRRPFFKAFPNIIE